MNSDPSIPSSGWCPRLSGPVIVLCHISPIIPQWLRLQLTATRKMDKTFQDFVTKTSGQMRVEKPVLETQSVMTIFIMGFGVLFKLCIYHPSPSGKGKAFTPSSLYLFFLVSSSPPIQCPTLGPLHNSSPINTSKKTQLIA